MPERFRGELLTMGRYTNPASFLLMYYIAFIKNCVSKTVIYCNALCKCNFSAVITDDGDSRGSKEFNDVCDCLYVRMITQKQ